MNNQQKDLDNQVISFKEDNNLLFKTAASALTKLYANSNHSYDEGYAQGRQDAFEEVFKWFMHQNDGSNLKHVSVLSFFNFIDEKLKSTGSTLGQSKKFCSATSNSEMQSESEEGIEQRFNMLLGNTNRYTNDYKDPNSEFTRFNSTSHLVKKININLGGFNISDSRKRKRDPFKFNSDEDANIESEHNDFPMSLRDSSVSLKQTDPFKLDTKEEPYVYFPKRMKLTNIHSNNSSSN